MDGAERLAQVAPELPLRLWDRIPVDGGGMAEVRHVGAREEVGGPDEGPVRRVVPVQGVEELERRVDIEDEGDRVCCPVLAHHPGQPGQLVGGRARRLAHSDQVICRVGPYDLFVVVCGRRAG